MNVHRAMSLIIVLSVSVTLLVGYTTSPSQTQTDQVSIEESSAHCQLDSEQSVCKSDCDDQGCDIDADQTAASEDESRFVGQELEDIGSPFTRETVLKLNAIVERSLTAINEFDQARSSAGVADKENPTRLLSVYSELSKRAASAQADMSLSSKELLNSGEQYNEEIFSAMVYFVQQVDQEIREEADQLRLVQQPVSN